MTAATMARPRLSTTRGFQVGFLVLLLVCVGQSLWWIFDQVSYTSAVRDREMRFHEYERLQAERLLEVGVALEEVRELFPDLEFSEGGRGIAVRREIIEELDEERFRRLNRYGWEGAFFLVVLASGMVVLSRALAQRYQLRRRQENFLAAVSHELKSPLASIRLSAETLSLREPSAEGRRRLSGRILEDVQRLQSMIVNILETRKIEEDGLHLAPVPLDLADEVGAALAELEPLLRERGIPLESHLEGGLIIQADAVAVHAVVRNLVDNATKALAGVDEPRISVEGVRANGAVRLRVRDNGVGFPPREAGRLFEKFYRLGDEMQRDTPGSGLGLYLVRRVVEHCGGKVTARSDGPGKGATFEVEWREAERA